jgi:hypothetical protein
LKAVSNQRAGYANVSGTVLYAGIEAEEMAKHYKGEVAYNQEGPSDILPISGFNIADLPDIDDIHIATLTVAQTLSFALST